MQSIDEITPSAWMDDSGHVISVKQLHNGPSPLYPIALYTAIDLSRIGVGHSDKLRHSLQNAADSLSARPRELRGPFASSANSATQGAAIDLDKARRETWEEMRPHVEMIYRCARINDEMGRVVAGQTEAARALKEIFDRATATGGQM